MKTNFFFSQASIARRLMIVPVIICAAMLVACTSATKLEFAVSVASDDCPIKVDEVTTVTNIDTEGNNVVYDCVMDEGASEVLVSDMDVPEIRAELKEEMLESFRTDKLSDKDTKELIDLCKDANYNIIYRIIGSQSGYTMDIVLYAHEL